MAISEIKSNYKSIVSGSGWNVTGTASDYMDLTGFKYLTIAVYQQTGNTNYFGGHTMYLLRGSWGTPYRFTVNAVENMTLNVDYSNNKVTVTRLSSGSYNAYWRAIAHN